MTDQFAPLLPTAVGYNPRYRLSQSGFQRPYEVSAGAGDPNVFGTLQQMYAQCLVDNMIAPNDLEGRRDCMEQARTNPVGWTNLGP